MAAEFLTAGQVAERWRCSEEHVARLARTGQLRALKLGRIWRFALSDVEAFELGHTTAPAASGSSASNEGRTVDVTAASVAIGGLSDDYVPVFPELWGMTREEAASRAARRSGPAGREKRLSAATEKR